MRLHRARRPCKSCPAPKLYISRGSMLPHHAKRAIVLVHAGPKGGYTAAVPGSLAPEKLESVEKGLKPGDSPCSMLYEDTEAQDPPERLWNRRVEMSHMPCN
eukprot:scaffold206773_cov17-Tisochrysis_lutea.AAC.1